MEIDLVLDEHVGVPGFHVPCRQSVVREVLEVERDDELGFCPDGRREDVAVIRVGEFEGPDERLVTLDHAVTHGPHHGLSGPVEPDANAEYYQAEDPLAWLDDM
ncbi:hypothetical protein ACFSJS_11635 [Streptomyces desertarenae]|uniref:Uncharacterized protein n=1 Tax=Streptomyces desertarenae TaxID=2666184 RepID=A0ABW4PJ15_9ACTN